MGGKIFAFSSYGKVVINVYFFIINFSLLIKVHFTLNYLICSGYIVGFHLMLIVTVVSRNLRWS